ncbi:hypothetical protein ACTQ4K_03575 [Clostridium sporogenes]|uniref:hypothetical protein n=1 Tax=Clostridium sporogenes TaxID=1509 RepID=UPI003F93DF34
MNKENIFNKIDSGNELILSILKDPALIIEGIAQDASDAIDEKGICYSVGYLGGTFLGTKGLDKITKGVKGLISGGKAATINSLDDIARYGLNSLDDIIEKAGIQTVDDLTRIGVTSAEDLSKLGVNSVDDLAKLGIHNIDELRKLGISSEELSKVGIKTNFENEIPLTGEEWNEFLSEKYGPENVTWQTKGINETEFNELNKIYSSIDDIRNGKKNLVYDERTLRRMSEDTGPYHNVPNSLDKIITSNEPYLIRSDGRVEFLMKGTVNGKPGVYHMTIQDNVVKHKLFSPQNDWARFSKRWGLPGYDLID